MAVAAICEVASWYLKLNNSYLELAQTALLLTGLEHRAMQTILVLMTPLLLSIEEKYHMVVLGLIVISNLTRNFAIEYSTDEVIIAFIEILSICILLRL